MAYLKQYINDYMAPSLSSKISSTPLTKQVSNAYCKYLVALSQQPVSEEASENINNYIYHIGDSHCLSYAHRQISASGATYSVLPRITFGAKAFHFSKEGDNKYKSFTKAKLNSLPAQSLVFISFGEIDCRLDEGFISASAKLNIPINDLIINTVRGYLHWFLECNKAHNHIFCFFNVPAPIYNHEFSADENNLVAQSVQLFNEALEEIALGYRFEVINVFDYTRTKDGFSNDFYHVDKVHLGPAVLNEIERQFKKLCANRL